MVYDITKEATFRNIKKWIEGIREHAAENVVIVIVGNKSDLKADQVVTTAEGKRLAKETGCLFEETSAITGDNIESAFRNMLEGKIWVRVEIQKRRKQEQTPQSMNRGFQLKTEPAESKQDCEC